MARTRENYLAAEAIALITLGGGLILTLALISYSPGDVPSWFPLASVARHGRFGGNFIGPFGAILACSLYSLLGAAAYLLVAILLGCGGVKLVSPSVRLPRRWLWGGGLILLGACLVQLLPWQVIDAQRLALPGEGGWLGKWLGDGIFRTVFGHVGAILVLGALYVVSLFSMAGVPPKRFLYRFSLLPSEGFERWQNWLEARRDDAAAKAKATLPPPAPRRESKPLRIAEVPLERPASTRKNGASKPEPVPAPVDELLLPGEPLTPTPALPAEPEEPARPVPKIFDAAVPPAPRPKREKEKKESISTLSAISCENYELPSLDLLDPLNFDDCQAADPAELLAVQAIVIDTLGQFGIAVSPGDITRGPTITRYEVYPAKGVRVDRITSLERDLARATRAERINILAPIPGKDTVGIEIANSKKQKVTLRELLESDEFHSSKCKIPLALGKDVYGKTIIADLAAMPHGLVAGTTGSGKSVCINAIIASILYKFTPEDLRFIMIDPKVVEMQIYNSLPHLVVPVVTDPKKVLLALRWAVDEMEKRYAIFAKTGVRNIGSFNARPKPKTQKELDAERGQGDLFAAVAEPEPEAEAIAAPEGAEGEEVAAEINPETLTSEERITNMTKVKNSRETDLIIPDRMPYIVIIVDELADLMQTAPADVESAIARITQKARAAGIHMLIATQTPRADVITGVIKANVPCRIAFQVASALDSRVILDENGAERLLGQGDMLYRPPGTSRMIRAQGVLVTDEEINKVVEHASKQGEPSFEASIHARLEGSGEGEEEEVSDEDEELVDKCIEVMRQEKKASTSLFQRRLRLGYTRAARILDILEMRGYVAAGEGAKPREILVDLDAMDDI